MNASQRAKDRGWRRAVAVGLRALHVTPAAIVCGAVTLRLETSAFDVWIGLALGTGVVLAAYEVAQDPELVRQVRGLTLALKLVILAMLPALGEAQAPVMAVLFLAVVAMSHAPSTIRHRPLRAGAAGRSRSQAQLKSRPRVPPTPDRRHRSGKD